MQTIHGHEILNLLKQNKFKSKDELKAALNNKFGEVNFTNCTKKIYTFEEIIQFFESKGKVVLKDNLLQLQMNNCSCSN